MDAAIAAWAAEDAPSGKALDVSGTNEGALLTAAALLLLCSSLPPLPPVVDGVSLRLS